MLFDRALQYISIIGPTNALFSFGLLRLISSAFNKKMALFTSKLDLNLRKKIVKSYIWSMALHGAETWTLRAADQKYLKGFEMWYWKRMEKISWTGDVRNEEVLLSREISDMKYEN
jgi:hypothetical protein